MSAPRRKFTFLEYALEVLRSAKAPMTFREIWAEGLKTGLDKRLESDGKTPWQSLGARLFVDVRDNPATQFKAVGTRPTRFFLASRLSELGPEEKGDSRPESSSRSTTAIKERDLHPLLAYFVYAHPAFGRGKAIYSKTILHERSKKSSAAEWTHPDMVGFYLPIEDWEEGLFGLSEIARSDALRLYSFEIKRTLDRGNYRESFFQAVSNSSWSNEGYLVSAAITDDDDVLAELARLSTAFGIGLIRLDLEDVDASEIVYPATPSPQLDWETMNKLTRLNSDFASFVDDVVKTSKVKEINRSKFDPIIEDPQEYVSTRLGIKR